MSNISNGTLCSKSNIARRHNLINLLAIFVFCVAQPALCVGDTREYDGLMAQAIESYANKQLIKAEKYLKQALKLRPDDVSAKSILKDLHQEMFASSLAEARIAFAQERWQDSLTAYQKAQSFGILGEKLNQEIKTVELYVEATNRLDKYTAGVESLFDVSMQRNARKTLEQIKQFNLSGKSIDEGVAKLESLLKQVSTPQSLTITANEEAEVILYKVGSLGSFKKRVIKLLPGKYTAVARCKGHKEFRHSFKVLPNGDNDFRMYCGGRM